MEEEREILVVRRGKYKYNEGRETCFLYKMKTYSDRMEKINEKTGYIGRDIGWKAV